MSLIKKEARYTPVTLTHTEIYPDLLQWDSFVIETAEEEGGGDRLRSQSAVQQQTCARLLRNKLSNCKWRFSFCVIREMAIVINN